MAIVARKKVMEERSQKQNKVSGVPTLISRGWRSIIATLLALLLLCGNPAVLSAAINWTPKDISTGLATPVPEAGNQEPKTQTKNMLADMPLFFIENRGQIDRQVLYYTEGGSQGLYFTPSSLTFTLTKSPKPTNTSLNPEISGKGLIPQATEQERWAVKLNFIGANKAKPYGEALTPTRVSYFEGQPEEWKTGLNTCSRIVYPDLWPGIDLVFKGDSKGLKYEFIVAPGADPKQIKLAWQGAESIKINKQGGMEIDTPIGGFTDQAPTAWQGEGNNRQTVDSSFYLHSGISKCQEWGFKLGSYDPARILIIDPVIIDYCGYIGGSDTDYCYAIAVDSTGRAYVAGYTYSSETQGFPVKGGPDTSYNGGSQDAFVARVSADGTTLEYCSYIGGSLDDAVYGIAVDNNGRAYVGGYTESSETAGFPVKEGPDTSYNGGSQDAFVARVAADGTTLEYCGYIGGSSGDGASGIAVDNSGRAYVGGYTGSSETAGFPIKGGPDTSYNGGSCDIFVTRVAANGNSLDYCGYIGGQKLETCNSIAVDNNGKAYVTGAASSSESEGFPVKGGLDKSFNGSKDAFIARVAFDGTSLDYCGYIGGSNNEECFSIAVDNNDRAYVTGTTESSETEGFPVKGGPDISYNGGFWDAFVARVAGDGDSLDYCGYIGGKDGDNGKGIGVDSNGQAYVAGVTHSSKEEGFPVCGDPNNYHTGDDCEAFVACLAANGHSLEYCSYIGGQEGDAALGVAVDNNNRVYVTGETSSSETQGFPVRGGPYTSYSGSQDAFVTRVKLQPGPDLAVVFENPPTEMASGEKTTVTAIISNAGEQTTDKASVQFYIYNQLLMTKNISKLKPGKSKAFKVKLNVPAIGGSTTLKVEITPSGNDVIADNNTAETPANIVRPDLTVKSVTSKGT
ncbi:MAG: SBBP repeat-containing protein, partial [Chitinophagales bacterium]